MIVRSNNKAPSDDDVIEIESAVTTLDSHVASWMQLTFVWAKRVLDFNWVTNKRIKGSHATKAQGRRKTQKKNSSKEWHKKEWGKQLTGRDPETKVWQNNTKRSSKTPESWLNFQNPSHSNIKSYVINFIESNKESHDKKSLVDDKKQQKFLNWLVSLLFSRRPHNKSEQTSCCYFKSEAEEEKSRITVTVTREKLLFFRCQILF